jgi:hypothetical protein
VGGGLSGEMLAGAEADLEPQRPAAARKQRGRVDPPGLRQLKLQQGQALGQQLPAPRPQPVAPAAAVDQAPRAAAPLS